MSMRILPPVVPYRGTRSVDSWGGGGFGAPRGDRVHLGLDFVGLPGDTVICPLDAEFDHHGTPYEHSAGRLDTIHLRGLNDFANYRVVLMYAQPVFIARGDHIKQGESVAVVQDVAHYWRQRMPDHAGDMTNHVHLTLRVNGCQGQSTPVNPAFYFDAPEIV